MTTDDKRDRIGAIATGFIFIDAFALGAAWLIAGLPTVFG